MNKEGSGCLSFRFEESTERLVKHACSAASGKVRAVVLLRRRTSSLGLSSPLKGNRMRSSFLLALNINVFLNNSYIF